MLLKQNSYEIILPIGTVFAWFPPHALRRVFSQDREPWNTDFIVDFNIPFAFRLSNSGPKSFEGKLKRS
ncbi:hypothetical protein evm_011527 [Chilo suppressalis]|nr:hypothetical protein evm_011527 [Chilo suppressalis]